MALKNQFQCDRCLTQSFLLLNALITVNPMLIMLAGPLRLNFRMPGRELVL